LKREREREEGGKNFVGDPIKITSSRETSAERGITREKRKEKGTETKKERETKGESRLHKGFVLPEGR